MQFIVGGGKNHEWIEELRTRLEQLGLHISSVLCDIQELMALSKSESYLLASNLGIDYNIFKCLKEREYEVITDYQYIYHDIRISGVEGYYRDIYNNEIITEGSIKKCNIRFKGWNSKLYIDARVNIAEDCEINIGSNCVVSIGERTSIGMGSRIRCEDGCIVSIGRNCQLLKGKLVSRNKVEIGDDCVINEGFVIICEENTEITIGNRCLLSSDVHMRSGNGHSLFLLKEQENISQKAKHIIIGDHVWIGQDVTILYNTKLGDNCVVGAKSLVKREHADGCLLYGVPAQTRQTGVNWDVRNLSYEEYSEELSRDCD